MHLPRPSRVLIVCLACLFGVLVTLASMTQSISKWPTSSLTSVSWVGQDLAGQDGDVDQDGKSVVDDQCLDDIMVEPFPWDATHMRAPSVAIGLGPVLSDNPHGPLSPPPNV